MTREPARKVSWREQERLRQLGSRDLIPLSTLLRLSASPPTAAASSSSPRPPPASSTPESASSSASALRSSLAAGPWRQARVLGHAVGAGLGAGRRQRGGGRGVFIADLAADMGVV